MQYFFERAKKRETTGRVQGEFREVSGRAVCVFRVGSVRSLTSLCRLCCLSDFSLFSPYPLSVLSVVSVRFSNSSNTWVHPCYFVTFVTRLIVSHFGSNTV